MKFYRLLLAGLLSFSLLSHAAIFWRERGLIASGYGDFIIFYSGARLINSGRGEQLYDLSLQAKEQEPFGVAIREGPLPYNHLPHELLVFLPLAWLPYPYAYALWSAVNHVSRGCSRALWAGRAFLVLLLLFYAPLAPMWLMRENLFAWVAAARIGLAVIIARESSHHSPRGLTSRVPT